MPLGEEKRSASSTYVDVDEARAKIDRRSTRYRFDLERDIAWGQLSEPGDYFGDDYLRTLGVDVEALARHPEAASLFQWALALATCETFISVEEDIILFADRERAFLGECRSVELLKEEEAKHVALFRRYATHLRSLRPEMVDAFAPFLARCHEFHRAATENTLGLSVPVFHYQCWLYGLMLEESSIHLHDKIAVDRDRLNPAWLSAHRARTRRP